VLLQILLEENEQGTLQAPEVQKFQPQGLKVSSLTVQAEEGKQAKVVLKSGSGEPFALRVQENTFSITKGQDLDVLTVNSNGDVIAKTQVLAAGSLHADKGFIVNDVAQWRLVASEDFASNGVSGFIQDTQKNALSSLETTIVCGVHMVGGVDLTSVQTISKTYQNLPKHDQIMVKAVFNFIDDWQGESGFMQLNTGKNGANSFVWTHSLDITNHKNNPSMCGEGEGSKSKGVLRLSSPIEVATRHTSDEMTVTFGSSLTEPLAYYGVSSVEVYVRDSSV